jgi:hypothetical protein
MSKSKFGGTVLSVSHFPPAQEGGKPVASILVKVTAMDGIAKEPVLVNLRRENPELVKALEEQGLATRAQITFEARAILEWQEGVDRMLPAKGEYPAQPIHNLVSYEPGSIQVVRWTKEAQLKNETDETRANYSRRLTVATKLDEAMNAMANAIKSLIG